MQEGFSFGFCTGFKPTTLNVPPSFFDDEGKGNTKIDADVKGSSNNVDAD